MFSLIYFANDKYSVLKMLYDNLVEITGNKYTVLSQQEIANMVGFSKLKTNKIMQELRKEGYIDNFKGTRGKCIITDKGLKAIELMEKNR